jgi:methyl-accepting chemotaxis protein
LKKFFSNASIGVKVSMAPALALAGLVLVSATGWMSTRALSTELSRIGGQGVDSVVAAQAMATRMTDLHQRLYQSLTWEAIGQRADQIKALDDRLTKDLAEFNKTLATAAADGPADQRAAMSELGAGYKTYAKVAADTLDLKTAGVATAATFVVTLDGQYAKNQALVSNFVKSQLDSTHATVAEAEVSANRRGWLTAGISALVLAVCSVLSFIFVRAITGPLGHAARSAGALAQGDLRVRHDAPGSDATGRVLAGLDEVARNLTGLVTDIRGAAEQINVASGEIASGNADLSVRTEGTAASLQETAASVEQLTITIRSNADNARAANVLARDASTVAREGGVMVVDVVKTMDAINAQAKKIADIIGTIDGIAFQTNILALNAAVEAARAGEQGRGFAVVAAEVRSLAHRSAESAREIRTLIGSSVEQIDAGASQVQAAGQTMTRIIGAIERVSTTVDDIARAASEQATGIAQVNQTVAEMENSTQQNAAMVEQATAATDALNGQAQRLVQMLTQFRTTAA